MRDGVLEKIGGNTLSAVSGMNQPVQQRSPDARLQKYAGKSNQILALLGQKQITVRMKTGMPQSFL